MRPLLLALALAGCASTANSRGVAAIFDREAAQVEVRVPGTADFDPARAANAGSVFPEFTPAARGYLRKHGGDSIGTRHVKALLACALLRQGEPMAAADLLQGLKPPVEVPPQRENLLARAAISAASACRAYAAREAVSAFLEGRLGARELLERHAAVLGVRLPHPESPDRRQRLDEAAAALERDCRSDLPNDPRAMERARRRTAEMRRFTAMQLYDDAAQLLHTLPEAPPDPPPAAESTLASIACALFVVHGETLGDLLPERLPDDRKQWEKEHSYSVYKRAKGVARHVDRPLFEALLSAEISATGWIETR